ncbi:hypothetical protein E4U42_003060, partial [Claviceps africana]
MKHNCNALSSSTTEFNKITWTFQPREYSFLNCNMEDSLPKESLQALQSRPQSLIRRSPTTKTRDMCPISYNS